MVQENEKKVFEAGDNQEVNKKSNEDVQMSNGENCGIVEFEGKRINTCDGETIVENGYESPDR